MRKLFILLFYICAASSGFAQGTSFTTERMLPHTPVKNQALSSTCWCFATVSFLESEILRISKDTLDLSEMHIVRHTWPRKAAMHLRMQGYNFLTPGGQAHDVMTTLSECGIVPQDVYPGLKSGEYEHNHRDLDTALFRHVRSLIRREGDQWPEYWKKKTDSLLDVFLGKPVRQFAYKGKEYTPSAFMKEKGIDPLAYIEITSYTHHPFYAWFCLESKYNWSQDLYFNVPVNDFLMIIDSALAKGYTVAWDGDVSERTFQYEKGKADAGWREGKHTQAMRQELFDNHATTVDHLMHIVGTAKDEKGKKCYITKNSWGEGGSYQGYVYISESYLALKTVAVMVHREALPLRLRLKTTPVSGP